MGAAAAAVVVVAVVVVLTVVAVVVVLPSSIGSRSSGDPSPEVLSRRLVFSGRCCSKLDFGSAAAADHGRRGQSFENDRCGCDPEPSRHRHFDGGQPNFPDSGGDGGGGGFGGPHPPFLDNFARDDTVVVAVGGGDPIWRRSTPASRTTLCGPFWFVQGCIGRRAVRRVA